MLPRLPLVILQTGCRRLLHTTAGVHDAKRTELGFRDEKERDRIYNMRQEYAADPSISQLLEQNPEAKKVFSIEFGDKNDRFNLDLYNLHEKFKSYRRSAAPAGGRYHPRSIDSKHCDKLKSVAVVHTKMCHLAAKMQVDPTKLRGPPQIKYHPHMLVRVIDRMTKNRMFREEVIWKKAQYVRHKKAEFALALGNRYDSYYVYKREIGQNKRFVHSRNNFFYRWVYYHSQTDVPYELHGKAAAEMHRWTDMKEERDTLLREIEMEDIAKYKHVIQALDIPPVYVATFRVPKPAWFRENSISCLSAAEVARLRDKRKHGAISTEEEEEVTIPARPTRFNELVQGWGMADQNMYIDSDFHFGQPESHRDRIPLPEGVGQEAGMNKLYKLLEK